VKIIAAGGTLTCPLHIVSDGAMVYFLDQGTDTTGVAVAGKGALYAVPVGNTAPLPPPLVKGMTNPQAMAIDNQAVYWVEVGTSSVMKLAK
jgi:hypothetical protein